MNLTHGIVRASYRDASPTRRLSIRLDISRSNFPRFDVNPNTGEPLGLNRRHLAVDNSVYHDAARPSALTLWLLPSGAH